MPSLKTRQRGAVFFDRDGVLNQDRGYIYRIQDFVWIAGAREGIRLANQLGFYVFVVTNQSGVARGYYSEHHVRQLHAWMQNHLNNFGAYIDDFRFCPHHPNATLPEYRKVCTCRKPQPGMIHDLLSAWNVNPEQSLFIGDKPSDLQAAAAAGIKGYLFKQTNVRHMLEHIFAH
jgi:D-glycero-D-manno-heptose 1,7-bisphosphate phosphatase